MEGAGDSFEVRVVVRPVARINSVSELTPEVADRFAALQQGALLHSTAYQFTGNDGPAPLVTISPRDLVLRAGGGTLRLHTRCMAEGQARRSPLVVCGYLADATAIPDGRYRGEAVMQVVFQ